MRGLIVTPKAKSFLKKLKEKPLKNKFNEMINKILENPNIGELKKGDLQGIYSKDIYHAGINYELAYKVIQRDGETVVVILAGVRGNFYEELKRYIKELDLFD
jgi:mRNA-degrading endonuclease RelE of RelBE toxin-antitoxin system